MLGDSGLEPLHSSIVGVQSPSLGRVHGLLYPFRENPALRHNSLCMLSKH